MNLYACADRSELKIIKTFVCSCLILVQSRISRHITNLCELQLLEHFSFPLLYCVNKAIGVVEHSEQYTLNTQQGRKVSKVAPCKRQVIKHCLLTVKKLKTKKKREKECLLGEVGFKRSNLTQKISVEIKPLTTFCLTSSKRKG